MLSGCNSLVGGDMFLESINSIEESITKEEWKACEDLINDLSNYYDDNRWKLQLLGDEGEYEGMLEAINRLDMAVSQKDVTESLLEIATIKAYIEGIYSL